MPNPAIGFARKAAGFAVRPLVDVPTLPGGRVGRLIEQAIEGSTSPIGILSTALLPVTGGASLGLRGGAGVAARLATRGAAEVGASAAGGLAAEEVAKRVQNAPGFVKYGAPLAAGFAGSAGAASGLNRAALRLEPDALDFGVNTMRPTARVRQGTTDIPASPASTYGTLLPIGQSRSLLDPSLPRSTSLTSVPAARARENIGTPNELRRDFSKIKRGQDILISRVGMEARLGRLTTGAVRPSVEFARSLPKPYLEQLASSYSRVPSGRVAGRYDPDTSIMTIFSDVLNRNPDSAQGTIIHEVAHHLEQFVDDKQFRDIQNTWKATTKPRFDQYENGLRALAGKYDIKVPSRADHRLLEEALQERIARARTVEDAALEDDLAKLQERFTYAERGGINEWFAEQVREAELTRQAGIVPNSIREFIRKTGDIVRGYNQQAAPDVVRKLQAAR